MSGRELPRTRDGRELMSLMLVAAELGVRSQTLWAKLRRAGIPIYRTRIGTTHVSAIAREDLPRLGLSPTPVRDQEEPEIPAEPPERFVYEESGPSQSELRAALEALEEAKESSRADRAKNRELQAALSDLKADLNDQAKEFDCERETFFDRAEQMARTRMKLHRTILLQQRTLNRFEDELRDLNARLELRERIYRNNQRYIDRLEGESHLPNPDAERRSA